MRTCMGAEYASEGYFSGDQHAGRIWEKGSGYSCCQDFGLPESLVVHGAVGETESCPIYSEVLLKNVRNTTVPHSRRHK